MALSKLGLDQTGSGSKGTKVNGIYQSTTDAAATIKAANYFDDAADELARVGVLTVYATNATFLCKVSISAGVVTIEAVDAF